MRLLVDKKEMPKRKYDCVLYDFREDLCYAPPRIACTLEEHGVCPYLKPVELPAKDDCK